MELGEKIRQARLEAGLSQRQLCGDRLTRNMLSLIENGSAKPSMDTLRYFAARLGKPVGWFLEEEAVTSPNQACMDIARACWRDQDGEGVLKALEDYRSPDSTFDQERGLLEYQARLRLAEQAIAADRIPYAVTLLESAEACTSIYLGDDSALQLLRAQAGLPARLDCDDILLAQAAQALAEGEEGRCEALLNAVQQKQLPKWHFLYGMVCYARKAYAEAAEHLACAEKAYPRETIPRLEVCYRELEDYKRAYEYACKAR